MLLLLLLLLLLVIVTVTGGGYSTGAEVLCIGPDQDFKDQDSSEI
jgi:hypothetical protein